jgi:hypothetical protein
LLALAFPLSIPLTMAAGPIVGEAGIRGGLVIAGGVCLLAALSGLLLRRSTSSDGAEEDGAAPLITTAVGVLVRTPSFWLLSLGGGMAMAFTFTGASTFFAFFSQRSEMPGRDGFLGLALPVGGALAAMAGTWLGGWVGDRFGSRDFAAYGRIPSICFLLATPVLALSVLASPLWLSFGVFLAGQLLIFAWPGPVISALFQVVPPNLRATAAGGFAAVGTVVGLAAALLFSAYVLPRLSGTYPPGGVGAFGYAILLGLGFLVLAALFYFLASRQIENDRFIDQPQAIRTPGLTRLIVGGVLGGLLFVLVDRTSLFGPECYYVGTLASDTVCFSPIIYRGLLLVALATGLWGAIALWRAKSGPRLH